VVEGMRNYWPLDGIDLARERCVYRIGLLSVLKEGGDSLVMKEENEEGSPIHLRWELDEDGDNRNVVDLVLDHSIQFHSRSKTIKFTCLWVHKHDGLLISLWTPFNICVSCDHVQVVPGSVDVGDQSHYYEVSGSPEKPFQMLLNGNFQRHEWGLHGAAYIYLGYGDKEWEEAQMPLLWELDFDFDVPDNEHPVLEIRWVSRRVIKD
jgi:hypothetical protein